jgi:hypothetical protein
MNYDLKAGAMISLIIDSAENFSSITDELNYVIQDIPLTEDGYGIVLSLAAQAATLAILLGKVVQQDPSEMWAAIMAADDGFLKD